MVELDLVALERQIPNQTQIEYNIVEYERLELPKLLKSAATRRRVGAQAVRARLCVHFGLVGLSLLLVLIARYQLSQMLINLNELCQTRAQLIKIVELEKYAFEFLEISLDDYGQLGVYSLNVFNL